MAILYFGGKKKKLDGIIVSSFIYLFLKRLIYLLLGGGQDRGRRESKQIPH